MQGQAFGAPGAQRVADFRVLDLDDLGALVGQLQADHVAGDQAGQVYDPDPVQRHGRGRVEGDARYHCVNTRGIGRVATRGMDCVAWFGMIRSAGIGVPPLCRPIIEMAPDSPQ